MPNRHSKKQVEISLKPVEAETTRANSALRFRESSNSDLKASEIKPLRVNKKAKVDSTHLDFKDLSGPSIHLATGTFKGQDEFVKRTEAHV